ncbi:MAG: hypothetical protein QOH15_2475, partial [Gaiellales bacterium]|nr:hypothetical protein [Gaiellales bacterium]
GQSMDLKLMPKGTRTVARSVWTKVRRAVTASRKVTAAITLTMVDAAGNARSVKRTITLS